MEAIKPGSIILFKGKGILYEILSRTIKLKYPWWDRWGWHMAIAIEEHQSYAWMIAEALAGGVQYGWLNQKNQEYRVINWCGDVHPASVRKYASERLGCKYDALAYIWTTLQEFFPWLPRIVNRHYTCWEFVYEFCREVGHPVQQPHEYPMITDIMREKNNA